MPRSASVTCSATWAITRIATTPLPRVAQATHVLHKPIFSSALVNKNVRVAPPHPRYLDDASATYTGTAQISETPPELLPSHRAPKRNPGAWIRNLLEDGDVESHPGPARFVSKNVNGVAGPGKFLKMLRAQCVKTIPLLERSRYGGLYASQRLAQRFLALQRGPWGR
jgi:hypothetical protein